MTPVMQTNSCGNVLLFFVSCVLSHNFIFSRFLGCCPFLGVSNKVETAAGMGLLALIGPASDYLTQVALPMALLGIGQGLCLGPLTQAGVARVGSSEAGAAAGAVNTAHQLGGTLGLALQVAVFAGSGPHLSRAELPAVLAHRIAACMAVGSGLLFSALLVVWLFILMPQPVTPVSSNP